MMKVALLLALLTVSEGSSVVGRAGAAINLSCIYDAGLHGALSVCWGRGTIPTSGCGGLLVSTDGLRVQEGTRASSRYQLLGALERGDATLTIRNLSLEDAGRYGCRVLVPGWFNDLKIHVDLLVQDAPQTTSSTLPGETASEPPTGHVTSTQRLDTSCSSGVTAELRGRDPEEVHNVDNGSSSVSLVLVGVLVGSVFLVTAAVLIMVLTRRRLGKSARQPVPGSVRFWSSSSSGPQVRVSRESAVENVYQMDGDDGGEYESCP